MNELDKKIFVSLFKQACLKCFGFPLTSFLTETDSKLLSNKIFESTGLVIGAKSIKNYSLFVLSTKSNDIRKENPSVATLDTLARYVLDAPYTDEVQRKETEGHYPYWFQYRTRFSSTSSNQEKLNPNLKKTVVAICTVVIVCVLGFMLIKSFVKRNNSNEVFYDNFNSVSDDSLKSRGWVICSEDTTWWNKRNEKPGHLTLYTLKGDNWSDSVNHTRIKNLVMRRINSDCFIVEIHMTNFYPHDNWQQAGILLSEDSTFNGKMIRLSISYNDFFGGYKRPPEIIIQGVSSSQDGIQSKPEEFAHFSLNNIEPGQEALVGSNLAKTALKIEKKNGNFRFLYIASPIESFAFKEVVSRDFNIQPRYVGIFAIHGWTTEVNPIPVYFDSFNYAGIPCNK
jgi:hypothetical protein